MPGLFDNSPGPSGGILGGLTRTLFPGFYQEGLRQQALRGMQQMQPNLTPEQATLAQQDPGAYEAMWKQKIFWDQYHDWQGKNPNKDFNQFLYDISGPGQELNYGLKAGQPIEGEGGMKIPTGFFRGQPFIGIPGGAPNSQQQQPPSSQPGPSNASVSGSGAVPPGLQQAQPYIDYLRAQAAAGAGAKKSAETTAAAAPDLPILQTRSQQLISKLEAIRDNPELPNVVGGPLGVKGRTRPIGQNQSDLVNAIQDANNALQGDLFTSLRATSGRGVSPGALKEMRITDLQAGRTGTLEGYKDNINKTIKQIQEEYGAAWQARGSPNTHKPAWSTTQTAPQYAEGQTATNKQTGERRIFRAGQWAPLK